MTEVTAGIEYKINIDGNGYLLDERKFNLLKNILFFCLSLTQPSDSPRSPASHAFPACGEGAPVLTPGRMRSRARTRANYYIEETFLAALPSFRSWGESKEGPLPLFCRFN